MVILLVKLIDEVLVGETGRSDEMTLGLLNCSTAIGRGWEQIALVHLETRTEQIC